MGVSAATETGAKTYPVNGSFTYNTTPGSQTIQQLASIMHMSFERSTMPNGQAWSNATNWQITKVSGSSGVSFSTTGNQYNSNLIFTYPRTSNTTLTWTGYVTAEYNGTTYKANISLNIHPYLSDNDIRFTTPTVTKQLTGTSLTYTQTATSSSTATKTYSISPTTGASINSSNGQVTVTKAGTYTITCSQPAKWQQTNSYDAGSATYTLVVTSVPVIQEYYSYSTSNKVRWLKDSEVLTAAGQSASSNVQVQKVEMLSTGGVNTTVNPTEYSSSVNNGVPYGSIKSIIQTDAKITINNSGITNFASTSANNLSVYYPSLMAMSFQAGSSSYPFLGFDIKHPAKEPIEYQAQVYVASSTTGTPYRVLYVSSPDPAKVNAIKMKNGTGAMSNGVCNFSIPSLRTDAVTGTTVYSVLSATDLEGNPLVEGVDYTIDTSTGDIATKKVGTFSVKTDFKGNSSTGYFPAEATSTFTVTKGTGAFYHKTMSCVINEIDLTHGDFDYPGFQTMDDNWAANARKLRYVNTNRAYDELPQNYLNDQIVLKTTDESAVASGKIVIGADDKIVSNPVISDEAQFDYVIPNNGNLELADGSNVTFTRKGFPGVNAKGQYTYGTICLPFAVAEEDMPAGFKFEKYDNNIIKDGSRYSVFHEVSSLQAGVPYLVYNTGSTSADLAINSDAASAWATNPTADSYYMGTFNDLIFDDINSNTATNPYNNVSADNAEHKGELNNYFASLYNYNSDGYLMANPGGDKIKKSSKTVFNKTMLRPFRAYFLLAKGAPASAMAMGVLHYSLDDEQPTAISYLDAEGNQIDVVDVYTVSGVRVAKGKLQTEALNNLPAGLYILSNGKKVSKK